MLKVPEGFKDLMPAEAEVFYFVKQRLLHIFQMSGFAPVIPPSAELLETFLRSGENERHTFNFIDQEEGVTGCFRYDFTPQIARMYGISGVSGPQRWCYEGPVLRNPGGLSGSMREIHHAGVEIIGIHDLHADAELITLIDAIFSGSGIDDYKIFVNDVSIAQEACMGIEGAHEQAALKRALINRDVSAAADIVRRACASDEHARFIEELGFCCGGTKLLKGIAERYRKPFIIEGINRLLRLSDMVGESVAAKIQFDLGDLKGFEYHSGIIFDCYARNKTGGYAEVITGGRYDSLLTRYCARAVPATGFAVDVAALAGCVQYKGPIRCIIAAGRHVQDADALAAVLRKAGIAVTVDRDKTPAGEFHQKMNVDFAVVMGNNEIGVVNLKTGSKSTVEKKTRNTKEIADYIVKECA